MKKTYFALYDSQDNGLQQFEVIIENETEPRPGIVRSCVALDIPEYGFLYLVDGSVFTASEAKRLNYLQDESDDLRDANEDLQDRIVELEAEQKTLADSFTVVNRELQRQIETLQIQNRALQMTLENEGIFKRNPPA